VKLVDSKGLDVNSRTESGITPLHYACGFKQNMAVEPLLRCGAEVNAQTRGGRTPLHEAARKGGLMPTHLIVRAGAEVDLPDSDGWTPFYYACEGNNIDVARYLVQDDSDPWITKLLKGKLGAPFDVPLDKIPKADPKYRTNSGGSALHQAAGWGYVDIVALLLKHGAEVSIATNYGRTPLHQAAAGGAFEVANMLLHAGADPTTTDLSGYSARDLAEENGHLNIADILVEAEGNKMREITEEDGGSV
jgi:ankyrin repeat protein